MLAVEGATDFGEVVILHRASKTLLAGDLVVNFPAGDGLWSELMFKLGTIDGLKQPGVTKPFKRATEDGMAFLKTLEMILSWEFERIIVGHGEPVLTKSKSKLRRIFEAAEVVAEEE